MIYFFFFLINVTTCKLYVHVFNYFHTVIISTISYYYYYFYYMGPVLRLRVYRYRGPFRQRPQFLGSHAEDICKYLSLYFYILTLVIRMTIMNVEMCRWRHYKPGDTKPTPASLDCPGKQKKKNRGNILFFVGFNGLININITQLGQFSLIVVRENGPSKLHGLPW